MSIIDIAAFLDTDTIETFTVQNDGLDYDLDANGVTRVDVYVCDGKAGLVNESCRIISSDTGEISYTGNILNVRFGKLCVIPGPYKPKVKIFTPVAPEGVVIAGPGLETEIALNMEC